MVKLSDVIGELKNGHVIQSYILEKNYLVLSEKNGKVTLIDLETNERHYTFRRTIGHWTLITEYPCAIDYTKPVRFKGLWNCCYDKETHVIVFNKGERAAVCKSCYFSYKGTKYSLALFNPNSFVVANNQYY